MNHEFYKSKRWQMKREKILRRDQYECQESKRYGKTIPAEMVHHIYPVTDYPELRFQDWNLISLSNKAHNTMHNRDTNEVTGRGLYWQQKRKREFKNFKNK
ncbi:HNH endonuclease [Holzapfeliella sp. JNUCC 80]